MPKPSDGMLKPEKAHEYSSSASTNQPARSTAATTAATTGQSHEPPHGLPDRRYTMRLTQEQISTIKRHAHAVFGGDAVVRLFGSRTDDARSGGDVDLLIELPQKNALTDEIKFFARLEGELGLPVDVVTTYPAQAHRPIVEIAKLTGVTL